AGERAVFAGITRNTANHYHDFAFDVEADIFVILLVRLQSVADEDQRIGRVVLGLFLAFSFSLRFGLDRALDFAAAGKAHNLQIFVENEVDRLLVRPGEGDDVRLFERRVALDRERLEITAVNATRLQARVGELPGDVIGGEIDPLRPRAAAFAFVKREEIQV